MEAKDLAGNTAQATVTQFPGLGLRVLEKTKPTISVTYPTNGAYIPSSQPTITWTVLDDGSGIDPDTIQISVDSGRPLPMASRQRPRRGLYLFLHPLPRRWGDGPHTFRFTVSDHDGNAADAATVAVTVDTVPPTPERDGAGGGPGDQPGRPHGPGYHQRRGIFPGDGEGPGGRRRTGGGHGGRRRQLPGPGDPERGANAITVTATDAAGKSTTVTRNVTVDTVPPAITAVTLAPQPGGRRPDLRDHRDGERLMVARLWGTCQGAGRALFPDGGWPVDLLGAGLPYGAYSLRCGRKTWRGMWATWPPSGWPLTRRGCVCQVEILAIGSLCDYDTVARMLGADPLAAAAGEDPVRAAPAADPCGPKLWDL